MNTLTLIAASVLAALSSQADDSRPAIDALAIPAIQLEADTALMDGYHRYLDDPLFSNNPKRDA